LEKAVAEDPTIFEYDSIHEKLENQRHKSTVEQREADKEKKVGAIHTHFIFSHL